MTTGYSFLLVLFPTLNFLGEDGRVKTALAALQEKVFAAWLAAAQRVAFGALTRLVADKRAHRAPAVFMVSALSLAISCVLFVSIAVQPLSLVASALFVGALNACVRPECAFAYWRWH